MVLQEGADPVSTLWRCQTGRQALTVPGRGVSHVSLLQRPGLECQGEQFGLDPTQIRPSSGLFSEVPMPYREGLTALLANTSGMSSQLPFLQD